MKKRLYVALVVIMAVSLAACGVPAAAEITSSSAPAQSSTVVTFADLVLEAKARFSILLMW